VRWPTQQRQFLEIQSEIKKIVRISSDYLKYFADPSQESQLNRSRLRRFVLVLSPIKSANGRTFLATGRTRETAFSVPFSA